MASYVGVGAHMSPCIYWNENPNTFARQHANLMDAKVGGILWWSIASTAAPGTFVMSPVYWNITRHGFAKQHLFLTKPNIGMFTSVTTASAAGGAPQPMISVGAVLTH